MSAFIPLVHLILFVIYAISFYWYVFELYPPAPYKHIRSSFGGVMKYFTFWNVIFQCCYFCCALINDIFGSNERDKRWQSKLQAIRDFYFSTITFSAGAFVTVSFWAIWFIDRELIFPKIFEIWFPSWLNHCVHTVPLVGVLLELVICPHIFPSERKGMFTVGAVVASYLIWICFIFYYAGFWVYPILEKLTVVGRIAFLTGMSILTSLFFVAGEMLNDIVWKPFKEDLSKEKKH